MDNPNEIISDSHICYKNWHLSSTEMEWHIIKEGFESLAERGLAVVRYIADADSHFN